MANSFDEKRNTFNVRLQKQREAHQARRASDRAALGWDPGEHTPPVFTQYADTAAYADAYDHWLTERVNRWRIGSSQPANSASRTVSPLPASSRSAGAEADAMERVKDYLKQVDDAMFENFELKQLDSSDPFSQLPYLCLQPEEFLTLAAEGLDLSSSERAELLSTKPELAQRLGVVSLPGGYCLVNGTRFPALMENIRHASEDFVPDMAALAAISKEKWGWGFVERFTVLGQAMRESGLLEARARHRLGLPTDSAALARLNALERGMGFAMVGWQDWLWEYLACKQISPFGMGQLPSRPSMRTLREALYRLVKVIPLEIGEVVIRLANELNLFAFLFGQLNIQSAFVNPVLLWLENTAHEYGDQIAGIEGTSLHGLVGWNYFSLLEANLSSYCVPYAMKIIFNIPQELAWSEPARIEEAFREKPLQNPNTRMALLTRLSATISYDRNALRLAARNELKLEAPTSYLE